MNLRKRVLKDCDAGLGTLAVSVKYDVSPAWARRLKQRGETGQTLSRALRHMQLSFKKRSGARRSKIVRT